MATKLQGAPPSLRPFPPCIPPCIPHRHSTPNPDHPGAGSACIAGGHGTKDGTFELHFSQGSWGSASSRPRPHHEAETRWGTLWRGQSVSPSLGNQSEACVTTGRENVLPSLTLLTLGTGHTRFWERSACVCACLEVHPRLSAFPVNVCMSLYVSDHVMLGSILFGH